MTLTKKGGPKPQRERNSSIIRLHKRGRRLADIASEFEITPGRVCQIVAKGAAIEQRRAELKKRYGERPTIGGLADRTPVDVLVLCDADIPGWAKRVGELHSASIKTLGDLRSVADAKLLREPKFGKGFVAQLRLFCPFRSNHPGGRKV
jgi:hypothetical protein